MNAVDGRCDRCGCILMLNSVSMHPDDIARIPTVIGPRSQRPFPFCLETIGTFSFFSSSAVPRGKPLMQYAPHRCEDGKHPDGPIEALLRLRAQWAASAALRKEPDNE